MSDSADTRRNRIGYGSKELYADGALGIFTVVAFIFLVWGFCWLKSYSSLRLPQRINIYFSQVAGLNENAPVYVDGVRVGVVDRLEWQDNHKVLVSVRINSSRVVVPKGARFVILTNGIVGAKYVEIELPDHDAGLPKPRALTADDYVKGEDPVRPELAVNQLAIGLSNIDMEQLQHNFEADRARLVRAADQLAILAEKTMPVIDRALPLEEAFLALSKDLTRLTSKLSNMLDNPKLSDDLKETAKQARETVETARSIMTELNLTLKDKPLRKDLIDAISKLRATAESVSKSVDTIQKIAGDKDLRSDVKEILSQARTSLEKVDKLLNKPGVGEDLRQTLAESREAIQHADLAARQLNQILNKRFPLVHMMLGRPGHIDKKKSTAGEGTSDVEKVDEEAEITDPAASSQGNQPPSANAVRRSSPALESEAPPVLRPAHEKPLGRH